jgi:membrane-anchored glycerophosphoryl diester phosphodiesterase (GDPDase)
MGATLFLIIPGIYVACRLVTCVPAALLEDLGPRNSLERSFKLTKDNAGRSFIIFLLYFILLYAAIFLFMMPFIFMVGLSAKDPSAIRMWLAMAQVGNVVAAILVSPFLTIATAVFYYDLRVRKEAFDLQLMMNPSGNIPSGPAGVPHTLS